VRNGGSAPMLSCPGSCRRKLTFFREQWAPCRPQRVRPVATQADALVLLLKAPICGPEGRARTLPPSRRHLECLPARGRCRRRHVQGSRTTALRACSVHDQDASSNRVHQVASCHVRRGFHRIRHYGLLAGATKSRPSPRSASCQPSPHPSRITTGPERCV